MIVAAKRCWSETQNRSRKTRQEIRSRQGKSQTGVYVWLLAPVLGVNLRYRLLIQHVYLNAFSTRPTIYSSEILLGAGVEEAMKTLHYMIPSRTSITLGGLILSSYVIGLCLLNMNPAAVTMKLWQVCQYSATSNAADRIRCLVLSTDGGYYACGWCCCCWWGEFDYKTWWSRYICGLNTIIIDLQIGL